MKAVIVIDVPDGIDLSLVKGMLTVTSKDVRKLFMAETYRDLELRPLPEKLNNADFLPADRLGDLCSLHYASGFNDCLNEITGEIE